MTRYRVLLLAVLLLFTCGFQQGSTQGIASDNFVSLLPGEGRRLIVEVPARAARAGMEVALMGWNVRASSTAPVRSSNRAAGSVYGFRPF